MFKKAKIKNVYLSNELIISAMHKRRHYAIAMISNVCQKKVRMIVVK